MIILLPPSETKRAGGDGPPLNLADLAYPSLALQREVSTEALVRLSDDPAAAAKALKLGRTQLSEVAVNASLRESGTMPAVDRYTGVLYDALDAASLDAPARRWLRDHVRIHSAPFGPLGALDRIPAYRLGAGISLPTLGSQKKIWADAVASVFREEAAPFVLDLRSEAYVALGPVPDSVPSAFVRVVSDSGGGAVRALNHFNKHAKGALVRALASSRPRMATRRAFHTWAASVGLRTRDNDRGEIELFA